MVEASHAQLSGIRQCARLRISRSGRYYRATGKSEQTLTLMRLIDEAFLECPDCVSRQMMLHLHRLGHRVCPYLLRNLAIVGPNQVWYSDITDIPMRRGFRYLVAIMYSPSRRVLSWRLLNTVNVAFCTEALAEALARHGTFEIFNTDQGSQFTSTAFARALVEAGIRISMDGRVAGWTTSSSNGCGVR